MEKSKKTLWPLGLTVVMALFMTGVVAWAIYSTTQQVDMVEENYYQKEVVYDLKMQKLSRALALAEKPQFQFIENTSIILIQFPTTYAQEITTGKVHFMRPSDASLDWEVEIQLADNNEQSVAGENLLPGFWQYQIIWSMKGEEYILEGTFSVKGEKS